MDLAAARHALVTGGASGIGLGIAESLAARGIDVTLADIDAEALARVRAEREGRAGGRFHGIVLDVRDRAGWQAAKREAEGRFGPVDILVNNAGLGPDGRDFADMDPAGFDRMIAICLTGVFNGISAFAADLRARGKGHVVNTASMAGITLGFPGLGAYAAAKHGVVAMSEVLRVEMAPHNVGVSVLCPGLVATNLPETTVKLGSQVRVPGQVMQSSGVESSDVGEMVVDGIARDLPYILTHPDRWDAVEKRMEGLHAAFEAALARG